MSTRLNRFLGDTPLRVALRLLVLSFVVGLLLSVFNIRPVEIYRWLEYVVWRIYDLGFGFFEDALEYLLIGALIVVPVFLVIRLLKLGGGRRAE